MSLIYLAELTVYDPSISGTRVLRYSTGLGFSTKPSETPADTYYEPRIITPANLSIDAVSDGRTYGQSKVGIGELVLANPDGALDGLIDYGFDGRQMKILLGDDAAAYPAGFTTVLVGTMEQAEFTFKQVSLRIRDRREELRKPIQTTKYAGTNSGASGIEGTSSDLQGKPKPLSYGIVKNITPAAANTTALIYQVHDGAINAIGAVYDKGVALTFGSDRANLAALQAATIAAGSYDTCLALGLFRLGSSPAGSITASVQGDSSGGYVSTAGDIAKRILTTRGGISSGDIPAGVISALNTANSAPVGIYISDEMTVFDAIDEVLGSIGAWWVFDRLGLLDAAVLVAPSGTPAAQFVEDDILSIERLPTDDQGRGIPSYRVVLNYGKNYTVKSPDDLAASVSDVLRAYWSSLSARVVATDATVQTTHLMATELVRQSLMAHLSDATTEVARLLALYKVRRDYLRVSVVVSEENMGLNLGDVVEIVIDRFGYSSGKLFVVVGYELEAQSRRMTLKLWG